MQSKHSAISEEAISSFPREADCIRCNRKRKDEMIGSSNENVGYYNKEVKCLSVFFLLFFVFAVYDIPILPDYKISCYEIIRIN